jgi:hypothetical protein
MNGQIMNGPQTIRRLEKLEASMGVDEGDVTEITIIGIDADGHESEVWHTIRLEMPKRKGKQ